MLTIGITMLFSPIMDLVSEIPFIGELLATIATYAVLFVAMIVSLMLTATTIAAAWFFYRPLLSVSLFVGMLFVVYILV